MQKSKIKINEWAHNLWAFFVDLIFPIECLGCGKEGVWLCEDCFRRLKINDQQYCFSCKKINIFGEYCSDCSGDYFLKGIMVAGNYEDSILASLVKSLKYNYVKGMSLILAKFLKDFYAEQLSIYKLNKTFKINIFEKKEVIIISVPLHPRRERERGFNQSELIRKEIAETRGYIINKDLKKIKNSRPQAKLKEKARKENIKGSFLWEGGNLSGKNIILIDDVATTGSTLNECARILKEAGAGEIWGLVVAKG